METKTLHGVFVIVSTGRVEARGGADKKLWGGILELQTKVRRRFEKITQSLRGLQEPFPHGIMGRRFPDNFLFF